MGRRNRQRAKETRLSAPTSEFRDVDGNVLVLRGSLPPAARRQYAEVLAGGLHREDARQRATEILFERLAVAWTIAGVTTDRQKELIGRYRLASPPEREFILQSLREHAADNFPELEVP